MIASLILAAMTPAACPPLLDQDVTTLLGDNESLCQYAGKVVLVVNVASFCGYTPQYKGLQELQDRYKAKGLVVLGFPSNDFGQQEPGSAKEIADFCDRTYAVKFPMFSKTAVKQAGGSAFYDRLADATGQRPKWNFHKYLISRDGRTVRSFGSAVEPDSPELVSRIEESLAAR